MFKTNSLLLSLDQRNKIIKLAFWTLLAFIAILSVFLSSLNAVAKPASVQPALAGLGVTVQFQSDEIAPGSLSRLTLTLANTDALTHANVTLTNSLPASLLIAAPAEIDTDCNAIWSAPEGGSQISITAGRLGNFQSCTFALNVTSNVASTYVNTTDNITSNRGSYSNGTDTLTVADDRPSFSMSVSPTQVGPGQISRITYLIDASGYGSNSTPSFNHSFPNGLEVADPANFSMDASCDATNSVSSGDSSFSYYTNTLLALAAGTTCSIGFDVVTTTPDVYELQTSDLSSTLISSYNSGSAFAVLDASTKPFVKSFSHAPVSKGGTVTMTYTIHNFDRDDGMESLTFSDGLDGALSGLVATNLPKNNVCGDGSTLTGSGTIVLTAGSLATGESCTFDVALAVPAGAVSGDYTSTSGTLNGTRNSSPFVIDGASNVLQVEPVPVAEISLSAQTISPGDSFDVTFTVTNTSDANSADPIAFQLRSDQFIPGAIFTTFPANGFCGPSSTFTNYFDPSTSDLIGGQLLNGSLALSSSCTFSATMQIPSTTAQGVYTGTLAGFTAEIDGGTVLGESNSTALSIVAPPNFRAEVNGNPHLPGNTAEIVYTIDHAGSDDNVPVAAATNISFTHDLDAGLTGLVATGLPTADGCGNGSTLSGTSELSLTGGSLQPSETCTMTVTVQIPAGADVGTYSLNTSALSSQVDGLPLTTAAVAATLDISTVSLTSQFTPSTAISNQTIDLEYTLTNQSSTHSATALAFNQSLSGIISGMNSPTLSANDVCGSGSSLVIIGSTSINLLAGQLDPNSSCTITIQVVVPSDTANGDYIGFVSNLTGSVDGTGFSVSSQQSSLMINSTRLEQEKAFVAKTTNLPGVAQSLVYTITNTDDADSISSIAFTDELDAVLSGVQATGLPLNDVCGSGSSISGTDSVTLSNGLLSPGASCTFAISVTVPITAEASLYPSISGDLTGQLNGLAVDGKGDSANLEVALLGISHRFRTAGAPNTIVPVTFVISNTGLIDTINGVSFADSLDITLPGMTAVNLPQTGICGPGSTLSGGSTLTLSGASLRELSNCSFVVDFLLPRDVPLDSYSHTIDALKQEGVSISLPSTATLSIIRPEVSVFNTISPTEQMPGQSITATLTYTNSGIGTATNLAITNPLPPEVSITSIITNGAEITQSIVEGISVLQQATLDPGASQTITVTGVVSPALNSDGVISATISITATADVSTTNNMQPISFTLTVPQAQISAGSETVTVTEEVGSVPISVTLNAPNPYAPVVLTYATTDGTATGGTDFTGTSTSTVTIPAGMTEGSFSIPILNDTSAEATETFTVTLVSSTGGQITGTSSALITIIDSDVEPEDLPDVYEAFLPNIALEYIQAPDLIVQSAVISGSQATIVIQNIGSRPVEDGFWVDLIVNPSTPPVQPNDTAGSLAAQGLVWGVDGPDLPLAPDATITLTVDGPYYVPSLATVDGTIPAGVPIYVHVDSADTQTNYGAVRESHEISRGPYNNILMVTSSRAATFPNDGTASNRSSLSPALPARPTEAK